MRYYEEVIKPLLLPFIEELNSQIHNPNNEELDYYLFQQDNAPLHLSRWTQLVLKDIGIKILEHIGNSPNMNAIEQAWMPIRINIITI